MGTHDSEVFESITSPGKLLHLISWRDAATADDWQTAATVRHRRVRVIRELRDA